MFWGVFLLIAHRLVFACRGSCRDKLPFAFINGVVPLAFCTSFPSFFMSTPHPLDIAYGLAERGICQVMEEWDRLAVPRDPIAVAGVLEYLLAAWVRLLFFFFFASEPSS